MSLDYKRDKEKKIIKLMIALYEKKKGMDCSELLQYAYMRIDKCPFMKEKTFCSSCKVHCYNQKYRKQMKEVMRFAGFRMLFYHPLMAIAHIINTIKNK